MSRLLELCTRLGEVLNTERDALLARDHAALQDLSTEKLELVGAIDRCEPSEINDALRTVIERNQRLNQENGALLALRRQHTERALRLLLGDDGSDVLYDHQGSAHSPQRSSRYSVQT